MRCLRSVPGGQYASLILPGMLIKTRGIVFRTVKYGETSVIADIYTEEKGLQQYYLNGVRSEKARLKAGLLQVMSLLNLEAYSREDKQLHRIREARSAYVYQTIPFDVRKGAIALFMAEVARKTIREVEPNPALFGFLVDVLTTLDHAEAHFSNTHLYFLVHLSAFLGFFPGGDYSDETPCFDLREGLFAPGHTQEAQRIPPELSQILARLLDVSQEEAGQLPITRNQRNALLQHLLEYYRLHIDHLPEFQAHLILKEVF